ncbi:hypothetical protein DIPPA_04966 [Diplonema papillatum]|nr:hypothetical protein DIPPA_04966 [Diplonema papillatum]|eukprot:gene441-639_t
MPDEADPECRMLDCTVKEASMLINEEVDGEEDGEQEEEEEEEVEMLLSSRAQVIVDDAERLCEGTAEVCGCVWSQHARTFFLSLVLFATITVAQATGALLANSLALLSDCVTMGVDTITYGMNLTVECRKDRNSSTRARNQLIASGISLFSLLGITLYFLCEAAQDAIDKPWETAEDDDDVNPYIVLAFAIAGIAFDVVCLVPYFLYRNKPADQNTEAMLNTAHTAHMNLCSALLHVSADFLRSLTTFFESLAILLLDVDGRKADTYAAIVVSGSIIVGLGKPIFNWVVGLQAHREAACRTRAAPRAAGDVEMKDRVPRTQAVS